MPLSVSPVWTVCVLAMAGPARPTASPAAPTAVIAQVRTLIRLLVRIGGAAPQVMHLVRTTQVPTKEKEQPGQHHKAAGHRAENLVRRSRVGPNRCQGSGLGPRL